MKTKNIISLIVIMTLLQGSIYGQIKTAVSKTYFNRAKFLMTSIDIGQGDTKTDYAGQIFVINVGNKILKIKEINVDCSCLRYQVTNSKILKDEKMIITFNIHKPSPGKFRKKAFIFFEGIKTPVTIPITGFFK